MKLLQEETTYILVYFLKIERVQEIHTHKF